MKEENLSNTKEESNFNLEFSLQYIMKLKQ
jgi:hypothetical protein